MLFFKTPLKNNFLFAAGLKLKQHSCLYTNSIHTLEKGTYTKEEFTSFSSSTFVQMSLMLFDKYEIAPYFDFTFYQSKRTLEIMKEMHLASYNYFEAGVRFTNWW